MDWEIVPGKKKGTWRILTTNTLYTNQSEAGWGLSAWGTKKGSYGEDTKRYHTSSWVHTHKGEEWPMDWVFEPHYKTVPVPLPPPPAPKSRNLSKGQATAGSDR